MTNLASTRAWYDTACSTAPALRRMVTVAAAVSVIGCGDTVATAPEAPSESLCATVDCNTFRSLGAAGLAPTFANATRVARALRNATLGADLATRIASVQSDVAAGRSGEARATLIQVVASIDAAIGTTSNAADWPDLSAIRINLEPVKVYLRVK